MQHTQDHEDMDAIRMSQAAMRDIPTTNAGIAFFSHLRHKHCESTEPHASGYGLAWRISFYSTYGKTIFRSMTTAERDEMLRDIDAVGFNPVIDDFTRQTLLDAFAKLQAATLPDTFHERGLSAEEQELPEDEASAAQAPVIHDRLIDQFSNAVWYDQFTIPRVEAEAVHSIETLLNSNIRMISKMDILTLARLVYPNHHFDLQHDHLITFNTHLSNRFLQERVVAEGPAIDPNDVGEGEGDGEGEGKGGTGQEQYQSASYAKASASGATDIAHAPEEEQEDQDVAGDERVREYVVRRTTTSLAHLPVDTEVKCREYRSGGN